MTSSALRLLVICDTVGATQQISFAQPLAEDIRSGAVRLAMLAHDPAWSDPAVCRKKWNANPADVLVLSRYTSGLAEGWITAARATGARVIFHIDDDLLNVPESLGQAKYEHYNQPARLAALRAAMQASDFIYASTPVLADTLRAHGVTAPIIPGDIYCSMAEDLPRTLPATGPVIGYMATGGHGADLALVVPAIRDLMIEMPELRFETFGTIGTAHGLESFGSRVSHHRGVGDYAGFLSALANLGWWVGIAPLEDTPFNRCKADTKWVEYSFAGIATVASDLPVYRQARDAGAGLMARSTDDWRRSLRQLLVDRRVREAAVGVAREKLVTRYSRRALRDQLLTIISGQTNAADEPASSL